MADTWLETGLRVEHERHGHGTVTGDDGHGKNTVKFDDGRTRTVDPTELWVVGDGDG
jgi:hypothetical protein